MWRGYRRQVVGSHPLQGAAGRAVHTRPALMSTGPPGGALPAPKLSTSSFFETFLGKRAENELGLDLRALAGAVLHDILPGAVAPATSPRASVELELVGLGIRMESRRRLGRRPPALLLLPLLAVVPWSAWGTVVCIAPLT